MNELLRILKNIYIDKLNHKNSDFRAGFLYAIEFIKIHGFQNGILHKIEILEKEIESLRNQHEFLKKRLELKKEESNRFQVKINKLIQQLNIKSETNQLRHERERSFKRRRRIANILLNKSKTSDEKVAEAIAYLNSIKETVNLNEIKK